MKIETALNELVPGDYEMMVEPRRMGAAEVRPEGGLVLRLKNRIIYIWESANKHSENENKP